MITLFPRAQTAPEELPCDPELARLTFLARHLNDLQSIRLADIPIAMMQLPLLNVISHRTQMTAMIVTAMLSVVWFYTSGAWFRHRYGRASTWSDSTADLPNGWTRTYAVGFAIFGLLMGWIDVLTASSAHQTRLINMVLFIGIGQCMGQVIRDRTNLLLRRTVYRSVAIGSFFSMLSVLPGAFIHSLAPSLFGLAGYGLLLLGLTVFDAWLLQRTFRSTQVQEAA